MAKKLENADMQVAAKKSFFERIFRRDAGPPPPRKPDGGAGGLVKPTPATASLPPATMAPAAAAGAQGVVGVVEPAKRRAPLPAFIRDGFRVSDSDSDDDDEGKRRVKDQMYRDVPGECKFRGHEHPLFLSRLAPDAAFACKVW